MHSYHAVYFLAIFRFFLYWCIRRSTILGKMRFRFSFILRIYYNFLHLVHGVLESCRVVFVCC
jgi:hypothetical protein